MLIRFDGRTALVSGAAQGIGRGIAEALLTAGARVHLTDRDEAGLRRAATELGCPAHPADLSDRAAAREVVGAIIEDGEGFLDILALSAGGVVGQVGGPIEAVSEADWRALFAANVDSAMWLVQAAAPALKASGAGRVVAIASGAGLRPSLTGIQGYAAAKHALVGLTRQLAWELGPHGVTVNAVAPGFVLSNPATQRQWDSYGPDGQARLLESIHLKRLGAPADIANAVLFLASEQAGWITGQVLSVDGGRS